MLERVARRVSERSLRWLKAHGYLDGRPAEERGNEPPALSALDACATLALQGGAFVRLDKTAMSARPEADDDGFDVSKKRFSVDVDGFNVNAAVRVGADMDEARERLVRYCARPAIALDRISRLPDGRIAYRMKYPRRGTTHRVMTPMEFMSRICALIPPPLYPLVRYHGCSPRTRSCGRRSSPGCAPEGRAPPSRSKPSRRRARSRGLERSQHREGSTQGKGAGRSRRAARQPPGCATTGRGPRRVRSLAPRSQAPREVRRPSRRRGLSSAPTSSRSSTGIGCWEVISWRPRAHLREVPGAPSLPWRDHRPGCGPQGAAAPGDGGGPEGGEPAPRVGAGA
jgi:Putative transposase